MTRFFIAAIADTDRAEIIEDLGAKAGAFTARKYDDRFEQLYDRLEIYPQSCALRPALGREIRVGVVTPFVIIYRYAESVDTVTILRLIDGRRDISKKLLGRRG
jgi:toxin ParE1/3/4